MRPIWKGYIKLSLVTIPVKLYNTIGKRRTIAFHLLHRACKNRIKEQKVCPVCNREVTNDEIIRGYEYAKDTYVIVTDQDLEKAQKESSEAIEIVKLVDDRQISPIYYSDSHYIVPDGKIGTEAFALFYKALSETKKTALSRVVMRYREHLLAIKPYNGTLVGYTLYYPEQIQAIEKVEEAENVKKVHIDPNNLAMAKTLIENMSGDFVPSEYTDQYTQVLMDLIKAKAQGEEIKIEPRAERAKVINLMEALKKSVQRTETEKEEPKKAMATAGRTRRSGSAKRKKASGA